MEKKSEKVILVGVETEKNYRQFATSMEELKNLTETAHGTVVFSLTQKRQKIDQQTILGKGKLAELAQLTTAYAADLVIFNQELSPRQNQLITEELQLPVIDRVQLILDIFALRARSKEGKLQVELAQLNYLLPRLTGQGHHLSRQGGGIGARGPGETKLETDRRHIHQKITMIKKELRDLSAHRQRSRQKRHTSDVFQIGLIGYTNAGKSTLLNALTEAQTYAENQLFATLDPLTKKWQLPQGMIVTLTDTVGFIQDLPTQLVEAFHSTLEESQGMDLLLHVIDASAPNRLEHEQTVQKLLETLNLTTIPTLAVYNKSDQLKAGTFTPTLFPNVIISAQQATDKARLTQAIVQQMQQILSPYERYLKATDGKLLHQLKEKTLLTTSTFDEAKNVYHVKGFAKKHSKWLKPAKDQEMPDEERTEKPNS